MLVIGLLALFWYGLVPVAGAFVDRWRWRRFRQRFNDLRVKPPLNYARYRLGAEGIFRFIGGFESVTDGHTLWLRGEGLTIPISLAEAETYVLPMPGERGYFDPAHEAPMRIRWSQVTAMTEGTRVFVGGHLEERENRLTFVSRKDVPLLVIFYHGPDRSLAAQAIKAGRHGNEYWNIITPYGLILGAFSLILVALNYLQRPVYRLTVISAIAAVFIPLFPLIPPGFLLTVCYRRLWQQARLFRAYRDLVRLPRKYFSGDEQTCRLPDGECYGMVHLETLPPQFRREIEEHHLPLLVPEKERDLKDGWYIFGILDGPASAREPRLPREPTDLFVTYGAVPGNPETLALGFTVRAYILEIIAWVLLLAGIGLNAFFIGMIIFLFG